MKHYLSIDHYREFHVGSPAVCPNEYDMQKLMEKVEPVRSIKFRVFKKLFDYGCGLVALPLIGVISVGLLILNPRFNAGPLLFSQTRVGQYGKQFRMWKFRTMVPAPDEVRDPRAALEQNRITKLGRFLRRTRIDEIPNLINVLRGEMSVVGPRPDATSHVDYYSSCVNGYAERHRVKPGITGLAQVEQGYVDDLDAAALKVKYDNIYVDRYCGRLDIYIIQRTFRVIVGGFGAK